MIEDGLVRHSASGKKCRTGGVDGLLESVQAIFRSHFRMSALRVEAIGPAMVAAPEFSGLGDLGSGWHGGWLGNRSNALQRR